MKENKGFKRIRKENNKGKESYKEKQRYQEYKKFKYMKEVITLNKKAIER